LANAAIVNPSFEQDLTGWVDVGGGGHGTWSGAYEPNIFIIPTDGGMVAYAAGGSSDEAGLSQTLVNMLAADTDYELTVDVANDGYYQEDVQYKVQLLAGGIILNEDDDGHDLPFTAPSVPVAPGVWQTSTVTYSSGTSPEQLGEPLEIRLLAKAGVEEMTFDNVALTADPPFPPPVVLVNYTLKLYIDGDKYDIMKIDVYPTACEATIAAGKRADHPTDIVNDDCTTTLSDFAELAASWLDDQNLTAPKAIN
jgi:hypothetical protein